MQWEPVAGYEGLYEINADGQVRRLWKTRPPKLLRWIRHSAGYWTVSLCRDGIAIKYLVHRLVALAFLGPPPDGCEVNHKDGNKADPRKGNLEWLTHSENGKHAWRTGMHIAKGYSPRGENHPNSVLTDALVRVMRDAYAAGTPQRMIAQELGVGFTLVNKVVHRQIWRHV